MVLAAFALCRAPAVSARALYVAFSNPDTISRYPLIGGIPHRAEWTFLNAGTPTSLAVDSRGTLFAAEFQKISIFRRTIGRRRATSTSRNAARATRAQAPTPTRLR
jgi:sugar lactone lactonase YvrE